MRTSLEMREQPVSTVSATEWKRRKTSGEWVPCPRCKNILVPQGSTRCGCCTGIFAIDCGRD